jgi:archaemetzincin
LKTQTEHKILISRIGELDQGLIDEIGKEIFNIFGYPVENLSLINDMDFALDPVRSQYHSTIILEKLAELAPTHTLKMIAVCDKDLFIPILTHVYGEAQLGGKTCIISSYRLTDNLPLVDSHRAFYNRLLKEIIHELGHTFNIRHCPDRSCAMHYCRTLKDVDNKSNRFCRYCSVLLEDEKKRLGRECLTR